MPVFLWEPYVYICFVLATADANARNNAGFLMLYISFFDF